MISELLLRRLSINLIVSILVTGLLFPFCNYLYWDTGSVGQG